jgi:Flp pilus assembly protein TadD
MDIQQFVIPVAQFDLSLLPPEARDPGSAAFERAVMAYFVGKLLESAQHGLVTVDGDSIRVVAYPATVEDPFELAMSMFRSGRIREGVPLLEALARTRRDDAEIQYNLGVAYNELGEFDTAVMRLKRAVELAPDHLNALAGLGFAYQRLGQSAEAEKHLRHAVAIDAGNPWALRNLAAVLASSGRSGEALPHFRKLHGLAPDDPGIAIGLAQCLIDSHEPVHQAEADRICTDILRRFPASPVTERAQEMRTAIAHNRMREAVGGGLRMDVVAYLQDAMDIFEAKGDAKAREITAEIAMLGMGGLDINNPARKYQLKSLPGQFSGLYLLALMYTGVKRIDPALDAGVDFSREFEVAKATRT